MKRELSYRGGFSDRMGIKPENTTMQLTSLDTRTRTILQNFIFEKFNKCFEFLDHSSWINFINFLAKGLYLIKLQPNQYYSETALYHLIEETMDSGSYDDVLTLTEALTNRFHAILSDSRSYGIHSLDCYSHLNLLLETEYVGYRMIDKQLMSITNQTEQEEVQTALNSPYEIVNQSLKKAAKLLSDRQHPDYENSIKESISAVEAMCSTLLGKKGTLGQLLKQLKDTGTTIHPSLNEAFQKIYGYTSDANGVRHASGLGSSNSTFAEAKYMLVTCSAFINYLIDSAK